MVFPVDFITLKCYHPNVLKLLKENLFMKRVLTILLAICMVAVLAACASGNKVPQTSSASGSAANDDASYIKGKGTLLIGITIFEPMNYYDENNKLIGFDTEFAEAVCGKIGVKPEFVVINWDTKEVELAAKSIDCIWNGFTITEERKENLSFSRPYIQNKQCVVIQAANASDFTDTASLAGKKLVAEISSAGEEAIADDENLKTCSYVAVEKQSDALLEVKAGTVDAAVIDYVMAKSMVGPDTDYADLMIVDGVDLAIEEYGIGFRKNSTFTDLVDNAIQALLTDGTLQAIAEKYGQTDVLLK